VLSCVIVAFNCTYKYKGKSWTKWYLRSAE
jgi:hypothetical protein